MEITSSFLQTYAVRLGGFTRNEMLENAWMKEIVPGLFLGNMASSYHPEILRENNITAIVSLTSRHRPLWDIGTRAAGIPAEKHKWIKCEDSSRQNLLCFMDGICDFVDSVASPRLRSLSSLPALPELEVGDGQDNGSLRSSSTSGVLIHCSAGVSRSPTIIAAYLMRKLRLGHEDVLQFIQSRRPVYPIHNFLFQLQLWSETLYHIWMNDRVAVKKRHIRPSPEPYEGN